MGEILKNAKGVPLMMIGEKALVTTYGKPKGSVNEKVDDIFTYNKVRYVNWGSDNNAPGRMMKTIGGVGVLNTGIDYRCRTCAGSGVVPVQLTGIDANLKETFEPYNNLEVLDFLNSYSFRNHHFGALRDLFKFGNCFPLLVFNSEGTKIVRIETINARHCRISEDKTKLLVFNNFENGTPNDSAVVYPMLDETDPFYDLMWRKDNDKLKGVNAIAFPRIKNYFSNNDYYALPPWDAVQKAGWIDVYKEVPRFLEASYKNAMSLLWHINVPYSYIEEHFGEQYYAEHPEKNRDEDYQQWLQSMEENLCNSQNANKAFITPYNDETGGDAGKWEIKKLDNSTNALEKLSTSVAANSEILFSLMINPAVFGAGMPGGSGYTGGAGSGSDIREAFMVSMILNHCERQQILDPVELMLQFNGHEHVDIRYRSITLTTLDTGHSTQETVD